MNIVVPHVGKSHLTLQLLASIPDHHHVILVDGSYVHDLDTYAALRPDTVTYVPTDEPRCLAANWNLGASYVPEDADEWMFCASDIQWHAAAWRRLGEGLRLYPDCGIVRDHATNWNVWVVRRWAWEQLAPMDERYKPCGGEDDDLVMKCHAAGIRIRAHWIGATHLEGGHATRLDIRRQQSGRGSWDGRHHNIGVFREKWGCTPSVGRDPVYGAAHRKVHVSEKRTEPPVGVTA